MKAKQSQYISQNKDTIACELGNPYFVSHQNVAGPLVHYPDLAHNYI